MDRDELDEHLPLTPRVFLILWALHRGPAHGYALLSEVEELGHGRVSMGPASLYEAMHRLHDRGLVEPTDPPPEAPDDDRRRRYYRLTEEGHRLLRAEGGRLARLVEDLRSAGVLGTGGS